MFIMKTLLPILLIAGLSITARAQDVPAANSVFGNGEGVNGQVYAIAVQADGKIVIGGEFGSVNGVARQNLARLNADGTLDKSFIPQAAEGPNGPVFALAIDAAGNVLAGGNFNLIGNTQSTDIARLDPTGKVDKTFGGPGSDEGTNGTVSALIVQPDGKVLIGGNFTIVRGQTRRNLARLNADGTLDSVVPATGSVNGPVRALAFAPVQGAAIAGGSFPAGGQVGRSILQVK